MLHKPLRYPGNSVYTIAKPGHLIVYVMHPHNQGFMQALEGCAPHALTGYHPWLLPLLPSHPPPVWLDEGFTEGMAAATDELSPPAAAICCPSFFLAFLTFVFFALSSFPCCERRLPPGPCKNTAKVMCQFLSFKKLWVFRLWLLGSSGFCCTAGSGGHRNVSSPY